MYKHLKNFFGVLPFFSHFNFSRRWGVGRIFKIICHKHSLVNAGLAELWAERFGGRMLFASTDLVFDGRRGPYGEDAAPAPLSVYGATKADGEDRVRHHGGRVVRLPLLFGADDSGRGATASLRDTMAAGERCSLFTNEYRTPLHAKDAAQALVEFAANPVWTTEPLQRVFPRPHRVLRESLAGVQGQRALRSRLRNSEGSDPSELQSHHWSARWL